MSKELNKKYLKTLVWISLIAGVIIIVASIAFFLFQEKLINFVISNSDLSNSMHYRKVARLASLPFELLFSGIIFILISLIILKKDKVNKFFKRFFRKYNHDKIFYFLFVLIIIFNILFGWFLLTHERIEGQDEGFHINNAKMVYQGKLPYIDFIYYKGPLFVYLEGIPLLIFGFNIMGERIAALLLKFVLLALVYIITKKLAGKWYGLLAVFLMTMHFSAMTSFTTIDTAGTITPIFILLSIYTLTTKINLYLKSILATLFLCISIATRIMVGPIALLLLGYFFFKNKKMVLPSLITGIIFILTVYVPFFVMNAKRAFYGMLGVGFARTVDFPVNQQINYFFGVIDPSTFLGNIIDKAVNLVFLFLHNWIIFAIIFIIFFTTLKYKKIIQKDKLLVFLLISFILLMIIILIPSPASFVYSFQFMPIGFIIASVFFYRFITKIKIKKSYYLVIVLILLILISPIIQYPRFKFEYRDGRVVNVISDLHRASDFVKEQIKSEDYIMGFEVPIIVEANGRVLPGLERGYFTYFPNLSKEEAEELGAINTEIYISYLKEKKAKILIMSERKTKDVLNLLPEDEKKAIYIAISDNYHLIKEFKQVSDWGDLYVYSAK